MKELLENVKLFIQMGIIGAILLYIGATVFMPDMTIKIFRFQPFVVVTESMEPVINVNDMVVARPFNIETAEVSDIITFKADIDYNGTEEVVTHYIYEIDRSGDEAILRTHRHFDNPEEVVPDTWLIPASDVIGSYGTHVPYVGFIIGFIKSTYGMAVIGVNILIFGAIKLMNRSKDEEELEQEETLNITPQATA